MPVITAVRTHDARYDLAPGEGADAVHANPQYAYAVTLLETDASHAATGSQSGGLRGVGLAFTLGAGNRLVCDAIEQLAQPLVGRDIGDLRQGFGQRVQSLADHPCLRWLGPHKGVVHLALASIVNACFDLWSKADGVPLWRWLLDRGDDELIDLIDLSYLEDELNPAQARELLASNRPTRPEREDVIRLGYPGYDTSIGWFQYEDEQIRLNARRAMEQGFDAMKLKVGSRQIDRDVRRAGIVREAVGPKVRLMVDANQAWNLPTALEACRRLAPIEPFWVEEPTHPDDVTGHQTLARAIAPTAIALGEHVPHRVLFKNFMQARAMTYVQVDAVRVAGVSEFLAVSLMARRFGLTVVPHVGDMGQLHQHLVLFNHVALGLPRLFLEYIPHLRHHFTQPARVEAGVYRTPEAPGASCDLIDLP